MLRAGNIMQPVYIYLAVSKIHHKKYFSLWFVIERRLCPDFED